MYAIIIPCIRNHYPVRTQSWSCMYAIYPIRTQLWSRTDAVIILYVRSHYPVHTQSWSRTYAIMIPYLRNHYPVRTQSWSRTYAIMISTSISIWQWSFSTPTKYTGGGLKSMDGKYVNTETFCNAKPTLHHLINLTFCVCMLSSLPISIKRSFGNYVWSHGLEDIKEDVTCSGHHRNALASSPTHSLSDVTGCICTHTILLMKKIALLPFSSVV